ncbi:MAG: glycosyltransferase [Zetaproteobacteria bacterium]|nr:glycosyltransferase [Zetaproteobacteria bacterium]
MKVSIVTISFNQAEFLEEAILSVLNQDYSNIEYIVVDPGSKDGSREIIEKYRDQIDTIIYEPDSGPADGLNNGFSKATGDVYAYLNADDTLSLNACSTFVDAFSNCDADVISSHGYIMNRDGEVVKKVYSHKYDPVAYVYGACVLVQQSTFFKASFFDVVGGFNRDNRVSWDGELWFDIAKKGAKFDRIGGYYSNFRIYEDSITGSGRYRSMSLDVLKRHAADLKLSNVGGKLMKRFYWFKIRIFDIKLLLLRFRKN